MNTRYTIVSLVGFVLVVGCSLEGTPNRVKVLNDNLKELTQQLAQVTDETTCNEHLPKINELADKMRETRAAISEARQGNKDPMKAAVMQHDNWNRYNSLMVTFNRQMSRISELEDETPTIIKKALDGAF